MAANKFAFDHPDDALTALADRLGTAKNEDAVSIDDCFGRVLAGDVVADRDSPAADVSAMDGYAIRMSDLVPDAEIPIGGESAPGTPPPAMTTGAVIRIFTGAIVPDGSEAVIKREDTEELDGAIRFRPSALTTPPGEHIRRAGENAKAGSTVLSGGINITAAHLATMANFGCDRTDVHSRVRVSIITTGDEVGSVSNEKPQPWQLRNSNRASLGGVLAEKGWIDRPTSDHCLDDRQTLTDMLAARLEQSDAVLLTGGVSMGDYDYVPDVVREVGGEVVFHGLPIRPGKPILGAATGDGKLIIGLPGNPVSATIGCRRMALPLLAKLSGQTNWQQPCALVGLIGAGDKCIPLHWMRLARLTDHGIAQTVMSQGSGDLVSLGQSTGFVHVPPGQSGEGPWPYYGWN
jgi:molybdopterin molybdotransferase